MSTEVIKQELTFNQQLSRGLIFFGVPVLLMWGYFSYYVPHHECEGLVEYHPATDSVPANGAWVPAIQGEGEYYTYYLEAHPKKQFKTKSEAVSDCLVNY